MADIESWLEYSLWHLMDVTRQSGRSVDLLPKVLGLVFLRFLGEHPESMPLIVPPECQWSELSSGDSAASLRRAVASLEAHPDNKLLDCALSRLGILDLEHNNELLGSLVSELAHLDLGEVGRESLAVAVDRLIERGSRASGRQGGGTYTPRNVSLLLAQLLDPEPGSTIYDPACGMGSLLLAAYQQATAKGSDAPAKLYGQEIDSRIAALATINLLIHGVTSFKIATGDTLVEPQFVEADSLQHFDYVISVPPMGLRLSPERLASIEPDQFGRFTFGLVSHRAEWAFVQHALASIRQSGRTVLLISPSILFAGGQERQIREALVQANVVEAVVSLPEALLPTSGIRCATLTLSHDKAAKMKRRTLFVFADDEYSIIDGQRSLDVEQMRKIADVVESKRESPRFAALVKTDEIEAMDCNLSPARYVDFLGAGEFLGGTVEWQRLEQIADVQGGTRLGKYIRTEGDEPIIRGRDIDTQGVKLSELKTVDIPEDLKNPRYARSGDLLIQRIGSTPKACLATEDINDVLVSDTVYLVRLGNDSHRLASYLVEFLNSSPGQALLQMDLKQSTIPTLSLKALRKLNVPIPEDSVISLLSELRQTESNFLDRIKRTRELRTQLFSITDAERVSSQLREISTQTQVLSGSLQQMDDLDFQIRNFYPFPIAYPYRTLASYFTPSDLYKEQIRVAGNILAFLGSVGLLLAVHIQKDADLSIHGLSYSRLREYWQGGINSGEWQSLSRDSAKAIRNDRQLAVMQSFGSIWFKGNGDKESEFAKGVGELVDKRNDFHHDRGPKIPDEFVQENEVLSQRLAQCLRSLSFVIGYPIRLVESMDEPWGMAQKELRCLQYVGDHPGLWKENISVPEDMSISQGKLYMELTEDNWLCLYPLISVHYCPMCKTRETYMLDIWNGSRGRALLKSFERGHVLTNKSKNKTLVSGAANAVRQDFHHWLNMHFPESTQQSQE